MSEATKVRLSNGQTAYVRRGTGPCEVHEVSDEALPRTIVHLALRKHPIGIDICQDCIHRARVSIDKKKRQGGTRA